MNTVELWHNEAAAQRTVDALKKNGFNAVYIPDPEDAADEVMSHIAEGMSVGFGGSMTIQDLDIPRRAKAKGAVILDHNAPDIAPDEKLKVMRAQLSCDLFLCSSNALTVDGELVNIDGAGNRVA
ncbi:MAG: LUD domain-containing protein, partial [Spirochaetota bacterium]